ncbi:substrate-binding periplasmic protein [Ferrovibrio sp.]|uniref:substrate-binding periplasmic protein n=1 Tax=Ferrovibrio sp. TaxID=1917215 RepID=UPI003D11F3C6
MNRFRRVPVLLAALLCLVSAIQIPVARISAAHAADIIVGFRVVAPYVIEADDGRLSGLEFEIVRDVLHRAGHGLQPRLLPLARLAEDFRRGALPAFTPAAPAMNLPGCLSDVVLVYENIGLSLAERDVAADSIAGLRGLRLLAFQNARSLLPGIEEAIAGARTEYGETANQMLQVRALFSQRADVILGERRIFRTLIAAPESHVDAQKPLREHRLFPPNPYHVAFASRDLCDAFNRALASFRASGDYDRLMQRYDPVPQARDDRRRRSGAIEPPRQNS